MNKIALVFVDGQLAESLSALTLLPPTILSRKHNEMILRFPKNLKIPFPIYFKFLNSGKDISQKTIIHAEENSDVVLVEEFAEQSAEHYVTQTEHQIFLKPNARLHYYKLQDEAPLANHQATFAIEQQQGSVGSFFFADTGSQSLQTSIAVQLCERDAVCHLQGLYCLQNDKQQFINKLNVKHIAPHCTSSMYFKGILAKQAKAHFFGKVHVQQDALHTVSEQANHHLLLSEWAEAKTEPHLEIDADDVKCKHGATVGQLDPESLFYLRSRGLHQDQAHQILTEAFANDVFDKMTHGEVRHFMRKRVSIPCCR